MRPRTITALGSAFCLGGAVLCLCSLAAWVGDNVETLAGFFQSGLVLYLDATNQYRWHQSGQWEAWSLPLALGAVATGLSLCAAGVGLLGLRPYGRAIGLALMGLETMNSLVSGALGFVAIGIDMNQFGGESAGMLAAATVYFLMRIFFPAVCVAALLLPTTARAFRLDREPPAGVPA